MKRTKNLKKNTLPILRKIVTELSSYEAHFSTPGGDKYLSNQSKSLKKECAKEIKECVKKISTLIRKAL